VVPKGQQFLGKKKKEGSHPLGGVKKTKTTGCLKDGTKTRSKTEAKTCFVVFWCFLFVLLFFLLGFFFVLVSFGFVCIFLGGGVKNRPNPSRGPGWNPKGKRKK